MLHTINKSPFANNMILRCLRIATEGDVIIFIEDGVYTALNHHPYSSDLQQTIEIKHHKIYALLPDLQARGISENTAPRIQLINYGDFVDLAARHYPMQAW
jgi:tRNA 2-thiouridine synthesizing protein B